MNASISDNVVIEANRSLQHSGAALWLAARDRPWPV